MILEKVAGVIAAILFLLTACSGENTGDASQISATPMTPPAASPAPNILLIISDDVGFDVTTGMNPGMVDGLVQQYGPEGLNHPMYQRIAGRPASTPVLDQFASEGMLFTNVWAHPFCSPTRASILTGLFSGTHVFTYADALSQHHNSFVRMLKEQGNYSTAVFGKWHMAGLPGQDVSYPGMKPKEAGFDLFKGNMHAALYTFWDYSYEIQDDSTAPGEWRTEPAPTRSLPGIAPTSFAPVVKIADTIDWITANEQADPDKPWFAWVAFNLSHATRSSQPTQMAVPDRDTLNAETLAEMAACGAEFGTQNFGQCSGETQMRGMTNALDTVVGKLIEAVDEIDSNTYIIYIGDNGTPMYGRPNLDFIDNMYLTRTGRGKGTAYESGVRVPMVVRGPGIAAHTHSDAFSHAADIFPTSLALAGLQSPARVSNSEGTGMINLDAVDLTPLLHQQSDHIRDPDAGFLLTETSNLMTGGTLHLGARNASHKIVCIGGVNEEACEFFDLDADPLEEFPLDIPASCDAFDDGSWTSADEPWHYCQLVNVVNEHGYL
jgi:arylsulfatase A-like enzyme